MPRSRKSEPWVAKHDDQAIPESVPSASPEYRAWINMRSRCNTPSATGFAHYGGRGIRVCDEWQTSYEAFHRDMGDRPGPGYSLDRKDVDGNYEPRNCRWATQKEQCRNWRTNRLVIVDGSRVALATAVEQSGLKYNTVLYRLRRGWSLEAALTLAPQKGVRP